MPTRKPRSVSVTLTFRSRLTPTGLRQLGKLFKTIGKRTRHKAAGWTLTSLGTGLLKSMKPSREQRRMGREAAAPEPGSPGREHR